ncbi:helix-turn-helix domain-containing protein [Lactococcus fujiensis]|uniref:helix-turn-helix domain-containing protein n=1 Tax=Lactococcus fujiensis TaxID=610251 RepID=UPI003570DEBF
MFLFIFLELGSVSISTFKESLNTSKNTILTDLKQVRQNLKDTGIEILYHQTRGFYLVGEEWRIRRFAYQEVQNLTDNYSFYSLSKVLNSQNQLFMAQNSCQLKKFDRPESLEYSLQSLSCFTILYRNDGCTSERPLY